MTLTYSSYLKLDELLRLQQPLSDGPEHDETLFIVVHQVYELWFKQVIHETARLGRVLDADDLPSAVMTMKRILCIFKTMVGQIDVIETMTPLSFSSFRARLDTSSGFQSLQFRQLEMMLGLRSAERVQAHPAGSEARAVLERTLGEPSLYDHFLGFLARHGASIPPEVRERDLALSNPEHPLVRAALTDVYRTRPDLALLCERLVDIDEGLQEWRYRHVKMVERTIGVKRGTGGSSGAEYLKSTLFRSLFPDLWTIRSEF